MPPKSGLAALQLPGRVSALEHKLRTYEGRQQAFENDVNAALLQMDTDFDAAVKTMVAQSDRQVRESNAHSEEVRRYAEQQNAASQRLVEGLLKTAAERTNALLLETIREMQDRSEAERRKTSAWMADLAADLEVQMQRIDEARTEVAHLQRQANTSRHLVDKTLGQISLHRDTVQNLTGALASLAGRVVPIEEQLLHQQSRTPAAPPQLSESARRACLEGPGPLPPPEPVPEPLPAGFQPSAITSSACRAPGRNAPTDFDAQLRQRAEWAGMSYAARAVDAAQRQAEGRACSLGPPLHRQAALEFSLRSRSLSPGGNSDYVGPATAVFRHATAWSPGTSEPATAQGLGVARRVGSALEEESPTASSPAGSPRGRSPGRTHLA